MRHLLYVGFYLQENFGKGNGLGDLIELGQLFFDSSRESALNWQDAFSNRLGTAFSKYLKDNPLQNPEDFVNRLCEFLDSPLALRLRPKLNLDDDDCK